jgi:hypothetical protein
MQELFWSKQFLHSEIKTTCLPNFLATCTPPIPTHATSGLVRHRRLFPSYAAAFLSLIHCRLFPSPTAARVLSSDEEANACARGHKVSRTRRPCEPRWAVITLPSPEMPQVTADGTPSRMTRLRPWWSLLIHRIERR